MKGFKYVSPVSIFVFVFGLPIGVHATALPTTNLVGRWVAGQGITESGSRISQWDDQTSNGYNLTQATSTNQPYSVTDYAGRPAVRFTQTGLNYMVVPPELSLSSRGQTIWVVKAGIQGTGIFSANNQASSLLRYTGTPATLAAGPRITTLVPVLQPELIGTTYDSPVTTVYNTSSSSNQTALFNATGSGGYVGVFNAGSSSSFLGDMYEILVYSGVQSAQDVADTRAYLTETYSLLTNPTKQILFEGDSITAGSGLTGTDQNYPRQAYGQAGSANGWQFLNNSSSGSTIPSMSTRSAGEDSKYYDPTLSRNVLSVLIGRNDAPSGNAAAMYSSLVTYVQGRVAAGWEVWVGTAIASGSTIQAKLDPYNDMIRGVTGNGIIVDAGASKVIDYGGDPNFDQTSDSGSSNYQGDATHPSDAGAAIMASILAPYLDTVSPALSSISATTSTSTATVSWTTDEAATGQVEYGTSSSYTASSTLVTATSTSHSILLTSLSPATTYHYRVLSNDANSNLATSSDLTFTTNSASDTTPPVISSISATTTETTASITFITNEIATSTVDYGITSSYGTASSSLLGSTTAQYNLTGLTAGTLYHFRISAWDASGNLATTSDQTFTTVTASIVQTIVKTHSSSNKKTPVIEVKTLPSEILASPTDPGCVQFALFSSFTGNRCNPPNIAINTQQFTRDLTIGSEGEEVRALQMYLNTHGFILAQTGAGSIGSETTYFGEITKAALARFQATNNIKPAVGYFGPLTRAHIQTH